MTHAPPVADLPPADRPAATPDVSRRSARGGALPPWATWFPPLAAALYTAVLLVRRASYVPVWDGREYADCVVRAAGALPGSLLPRCAEHPSQAYIGLLALVQQFDVGNAALILAGNAALLALLALAFARLLRSCFPAAELAPERGWLLALVLVHPVLLAGVVQPGLDFGACVFLVCAVAAALERRVWVMAGFGLLASFSKESGALLFVVIAAIYALTLGARPPLGPAMRRAVLAALAATLAVGRLPAIGNRIGGREFGNRWGYLALAAGAVTFALLAPRPRSMSAAWRAVWAWARPLLPLALPPVALGAYLVLLGRAAAAQAAVGQAAIGQTAVGQGAAAPGVLWKGESSQGVLTLLLNPQTGPTVRSYLALLLMLGFLWLPSAAVLADLGVGVRRALARRGRRPTPGADPDALAFVALSAAAATYILTRYVTYSNARYLLPAYVLLVAAFGAALVRLGLQPRARRLTLGTVAALLAVSAVRTADPVSRALWGVFRAGRHEYLRVTSLTGECCGDGRDQLAYNLQFTGFGPLVQAALDRMRLAPGEAVVLSNDSEWHLIGPLDAAGRRTLRRPGRAPGAFEPAVLNAAALHTLSALPARAWYLALPNARDDSAAVPAVARYYTLGPADTVRAQGYVAVVRPLARRAGPAAGPAPVAVTRVLRVGSGIDTAVMDRARSGARRARPDPRATP